MNLQDLKPSKRAVYIETYGCQMNVGDTEIVLSLLLADGWRRAETPEQADLILINTCSVREGAEQRIWGRLGEMRRHQRRGARVGVIGCMAERLKEELLSKGKVDIVAGPDAYRDLPALVERGGVNVELSTEETYDDVVPLYINELHAPHSTPHTPLTAFISIMRGCDNFCSYCVVPFTRGRERSRDPQTILAEAQNLFAGGCREVTLLGQNVNSYSSQAMDFPDLLRAVAAVSPLLRVRFATSHPKDLSDKLIAAMAAVPNICPSLHLPAQSGSTRMLELMNRKYTREWYLERLAAVRRAMPSCSVTTDLIAGFCGETDADHADTLSLMREAGYDFAYMFKYSERPGTVAARRMADDVPEEVKSARLQEIIALQNELSLASNRRDVGRRFEVLVEGRSRRRADQLTGRTPQNKTVIFDAPDGRHSEPPKGGVEPASAASPNRPICLGVIPSEPFKSVIPSEPFKSVILSEAKDLGENPSKTASFRAREAGVEPASAASPNRPICLGVIPSELLDNVIPSEPFKSVILSEAKDLGENPSKTASFRAREAGVEPASAASPNKCHSERSEESSIGIGDYVTVEITRCTQATLFGRVVK